jgi:hypothetical protein
MGRALACRPQCKPVRDRLLQRHGASFRPRRGQRCRLHVRADGGDVALIDSALQEHYRSSRFIPSGVAVCAFQGA